jgi:hypothetical protein
VNFCFFFVLEKKVKMIFYLLSGVLYEPYLLLDAPVDTFFASFPAGVCEAGDAMSDVDDNDDDISAAAQLVGQRGQPVGRIHERADFWVEHFCPDAYVRGILNDGYRVPVDWEKTPEAYEKADNKSARVHYGFVREEVARLFLSGQIVKWDTKPRCCNPLTVAVKRKL